MVSGKLPKISEPQFPLLEIENKTAVKIKRNQNIKCLTSSGI